MPHPTEAMLHHTTPRHLFHTSVVLLPLFALACSDTADTNTPGAAGMTATGGVAQGGASTGVAGMFANGGTTAMAGMTATGGTVPATAGAATGGMMATGGMAAMAGAPMGGVGNAGGMMATGGMLGTGGLVGAMGGDGAGGNSFMGDSFLPQGYMGTPFSTHQIPGTIGAADYDRGGPGVAYCHGNEADCGAGVFTDDWYPGGSDPYRPPIPANSPICNGAACDDNAGICRMNPGKPDNTTAGVAVTDDVYTCYMATGEWLKYTVEVTEAGTYAVGLFTGAPGGVNLSLDFGNAITTGTFAVPESPTGNCGCGESYHSWATNENVATVTFAQAGLYLMTLTIESAQLNIDKITFTKM